MATDSLSSFVPCAEYAGSPCVGDQGCTCHLAAERDAERAENKRLRAALGAIKDEHDTGDWGDDLEAVVKAELSKVADLV